MGARRLAARARALGELVNGPPESIDAALPELERTLADATALEVVSEAVIALGHAWDPRATEILLAHLGSGHEDDHVRLLLAQALPCGVTPEDACWASVVRALITLSSDPSDAVRDWACFGLAAVGGDTPEAREALAVRLDEPYDEARCEALVALAELGDARALEHLRRRLREESFTIWKLELKAAAALAERSLHPLLAALDEEWEWDEDDLMPVLAYAVGRCSPDAPAEAALVERALIERVGVLLSEADLPFSLLGSYPRTVLRTVDATGVAVGYVFAIWQDELPGGFPLEQMAQRVLFASNRDIA